MFLLNAFGLVLDMITWALLAAYVATGFFGGPLQTMLGGAKAKYLGLAAGLIVLAWTLTPWWLAGILVGGGSAVYEVKAAQKRKELTGSPYPPRALPR